VFARYVAANVLLYAVWAFLWGIPGVAGLYQLGGDEGPPLLEGLSVVALALMFFSYLILAQLLVYLGILYRAPRRRILAVLLSPLAVGVMFAFAQGPLETLLVVAAGATYGLTVWFPPGPPAWWEHRRRLVIAGVVGWAAATAAVALVQRLPAGVQTDVAVTIRGGRRLSRYRLACEYDRAGRVRRQVPTAHVHPGGEQACELIDFASRSLADGPPYLQRGCPSGARRGHFQGIVRDRPFRADVYAADCEETAFVDGETGVLVPPD
jgi:hypothetical protein